MEVTSNLFIEAQQKHQRGYMFNIFPVKESKKSQRKKKKRRNKKQQMVSREHEGKPKEIKGSNSHGSDSYC